MLPVVNFYPDYNGDTSSWARPSLRVTVYRQVVDYELSVLASIAADIDDHVREFEEACKRPAPTMVRPSSREQRRPWREQAAARGRR